MELSPFAGARAVTYDLWLTLIRDVDTQRTWELRRDALAELLDLERGEARRVLRATRDAHHGAWERGRALSFPDLAAYAVREAGRGPDSALEAAVRESFEQPRMQANVTVMEGVLPVLDVLAAAGLPVGLICDTGFSSGAALRELLAQLGIEKRFAVEVFSDELGVPKPYAAPFAAALAGLGVPAGETVHVGDLKRKDVGGAHAAGMHAARYRGARDDTEDLPDAEVVLDRHVDLLPLLGLHAGAVSG